MLAQAMIAAKQPLGYTIQRKMAVSKSTEAHITTVLATVEVFIAAACVQL